jgi:NAD(P)-dependent dehydrogenase (short-subunit alcohol dehydrogenase family)
MAGEGATVGLLDLDLDGASAVAAEINRIGRSAAVQTDVSDSDAVRRAVTEVTKKLGPPTILVNNAGISGFGPLLAEDAEQFWHRVLGVNLTGAYLCARHVVPYMISAGHGAVINVASTRALMSEPDGEPYGAAKGGLLALSHALAVSLGPRGIRVNAISPGWIHTSDTPLRQEDHAQHPVGRVGRPEDIAEAAVFLSDPATSGFLTGQNLVIDGGMTVKMIYV